MLDIKNIEMIECPKCHKKHFLKTGTSSSGSFFDCLSGIGFNDCVFRAPAKEIYLNGELQNPEAFVPNPTKTYFECLECGCHFSVKTTYIWTGEITVPETEIIDEDLEKEKREEAWKAEQKKREAERKEHEAKTIQQVEIGDALSLSAGLSAEVNGLDKKYASWQEVGDGTASEIDLGGFVIKSNKKFTGEQINQAKELLGIDIKNL